MMKILSLFCAFYLVFATSQKATQTNTINFDEIATYLEANQEQLSGPIFEKLLYEISADALPSSNSNDVPNFKPPKQIEEPVNSMPARRSDATQAILSNPSKSSPLWALEEIGRQAALAKQGVQDATNTNSGSTGFDPTAYCKPGKLPMVDPRTMKPVSCTGDGSICPSGYSCDMTTNNGAFCCLNTQFFPTVTTPTTTTGQATSYTDYCRPGYFPLVACQPNVADACSTLTQGICDTTGKLATPTSGFCCIAAMKIASTTTTTTTTTTTSTATSTTASSSSPPSTTSTSLGPMANLYCSNKNALVEKTQATSGPLMKRCSTSSDCSKGYNCDLSGATVQDKQGYCCSISTATDGTTTTTKAPKTGNAAGTILLSSGMLFIVVIGAVVSYSIVSK